MPGSNILHYGAVRVRVVGNGNLDLKLLSLDDELTQELVPLAMKSTNSRKLDRLANFTAQGARLRVGTDGFGDYFRINDITVFVRELWTQFPG